MFGLSNLGERVTGAVMLAVVLVFVALALSWCGQRQASQKRDAVVARTTGKALDKVATEVPVIRQDQQERENEVDKIEGSDTKLPDGFAAELERLRRDRDRDSR